jgi:hypothetical protein
MEKKATIAWVIIGFLLAISLPVHAAWETGGKVGFDSNVNRAINGGDSDTYLGGYLLYSKEATGETRLDWTLSASMEGNGFLKNNDLSNAYFTLAPGITFFPYLTWSLNVSPFVQGKTVADSDQSALAFGAKVSLKQPIGKNLYLGEYYIYTDSRANEDVYSYTENALGIYLESTGPAPFSARWDTNMPTAIPSRPSERQARPQRVGMAKGNNAGTPPPSGPRYSRKRWTGTALASRPASNSFRHFFPISPIPIRR